MTYEVIHYCHVLPVFESMSKGLTLEQAESEVKNLYDKKKEKKRTRCHAASISSS